MRSIDSYELNRNFGNNLSEQSIEVIARYLNNRNISFSSIQIELIHRILEDEDVKSVLAPKFEFCHK